MALGGLSSTLLALSILQGSFFTNSVNLRSQSSIIPSEGHRHQVNLADLMSRGSPEREFGGRHAPSGPSGFPVIITTCVLAFTQPLPLLIGVLAPISPSSLQKVIDEDGDCQNTSVPSLPS